MFLSIFMKTGREKAREEKEREKEGGGERDKERSRLRGCGLMTLTYFLFLFFLSPLPSPPHLSPLFPFIGKLLVLSFSVSHVLICVTTYSYAIDDVIYFSSWGHVLISNYRSYTLNEIQYVRNTKQYRVYRVCGRYSDGLWSVVCYLLSCTIICLIEHDGSFNRLVQIWRLILSRVKLQMFVIELNRERNRLLLT